MKAWVHSRGTLPCLTDWLNKAVSWGASSFDISFSTWSGMQSGPAALWGFSWFSSLRTPAEWIWRMSMVGLLGPSHRMKVLSSMVKTDLNSSNMILALSVAPEKSFPWHFSGGTPMLSCRRDLTKRQKGLLLPSTSPPMTLLLIWSALDFLQSLEYCFLNALNFSIFSLFRLAFALQYKPCFFSGLSLQFTCGPRLVTLWCCLVRRYIVFDRFLDIGFEVGPVLISCLRMLVFQEGFSEVSYVFPHLLPSCLGECENLPGLPLVVGRGDITLCDYGRGRARGSAGFDAPFNMGSTKCEIEWNSNFEAKYLTDQIKLKHEILNTNGKKHIIELANKNCTHTNKMLFFFIV